MKRYLWLILLFAQSALAQSGFWNAQRVTESAVYAGAIAADAWATQRAHTMNGFHERNPLARPFLRHGVGGLVAGTALGFTAGVLPSYVFYRAGHRKLSAVWLHVFTVGEAVNAAAMVHLVR